MRLALLSSCAIVVLVATAPAAPSLPAPTVAVPSPPGSPACEDATVPRLVAAWTSQLENLAFDAAGGLLVSDFGGGRLLAVAPDGVVRVVADVPGMHGLVVGPDGAVFVGARGDGAEVWRFSSLDPPAHVVIARGLAAANGLAFDADGHLFASSPFTAPHLVRVPHLVSGGFGEWTAWGAISGANGLVAEAGGRSLLAAITTDQSSPVVRVSTADPNRVQPIAHLSFGAITLAPGAHAPAGDPARPLPKGLDDLAIAPDGFVYVAAHLTGEALRVDPASGASCAIAAGFREPTSVRPAPPASAWAGNILVTEMGGVGVTALAAPAAGAVWEIPIGA